MSKMNDVKDQVSTLSASEVDELKGYIKEREKQLEEEANKEKVDKLRKEVNLGDRVVYRTGNKRIEGAVVSIAWEKVQVEVDGGQRRRGVAWAKIQDVKK